MKCILFGAYSVAFYVIVFYELFLRIKSNKYFELIYSRFDCKDRPWEQQNVGFVNKWSLLTD